MTLMALVVAVTAGAQGTTIHEYPWNPDWNNDNYIGSQDLTGFLSAFGSEFGNPPEPCDYDGTPLEELFIGSLTGAVIIDSIFVEFEIEDVSTYYVTGCPDPITDTVIFSNAVMCNDDFGIGGPTGLIGWTIDGIDNYGAFFRIEFQNLVSQGNYRFGMGCWSLDQTGFLNDGFFGGGYYPDTDWYQMPLPTDWYLDENGIHLESGWSSSDWPHYANYLHILPYWHYAE